VTFFWGGGVETYTDPSDIFSGGKQDPRSQDLRPWLSKSTCVMDNAQKNLFKFTFSKKKRLKYRLSTEIVTYRVRYIFTICCLVDSFFVHCHMNAVAGSLCPHICTCAFFLFLLFKNTIVHYFVFVIGGRHG